MSTRQRDGREIRGWQAFLIVFGFLVGVLVILPWLVATFPLAAVAVAVALMWWAFRR